MGDLESHRLRGPTAPHEFTRGSVSFVAKLLRRKFIALK